MKLQIIKWSHGTSVYLNGYRISGSKPWGGGKVFMEFECKESDIVDALLPTKENNNNENY